MEIKVGDTILFNWNKGIFGKLITIYNYLHYKQSKCTHTGKVSSIQEDGLVWVHEAIWKKDEKDFQAYPYTSEWLKQSVSSGTIIIKRPKIKLNKVKEVCESYEGITYDWLSVLLMPFKLFIPTLKFGTCSELGGRIDYDCSDKKLNVAEEFGKHWEKVSPMDFYLSTQYETING
jgi:hypothetical protein